jgi:hypothetical protein
MTGSARAVDYVRRPLQQRVSARTHMLTLILVTAACGLLALAGGIMQAVYPDAVSLGVVARHVQQRADSTSR